MYIWALLFLRKSRAIITSLSSNKIFNEAYYSNIVSVNNMKLWRFFFILTWCSYKTKGIIMRAIFRYYVNRICNIVLTRAFLGILGLSSCNKVTHFTKTTSGKVFLLISLVRIQAIYYSLKAFYVACDLVPDVKIKRNCF
jgi:hypothetical protein